MTDRKRPMIVCICNNVSDKKIRRAVEEGMTTMSDLRTHLDVGTCCGKCHACAKTVLRECLEDAREAAQPLVFHAPMAA
jgi:bacterioferritin-associated ferredoxin